MFCILKIPFIRTHPFRRINPEGETHFAGWARMGQPVVRFSIVEVREGEGEGRQVKERKEERERDVKILSTFKFNQLKLFRLGNQKLVRIVPPE